MLKVLFWISPITEMSWPFKKIGWVKSFLPRIMAALQEQGREIDSTIVVSSDLMVRVRAEECIPSGRLVELTQQEVLDDYRFNELLSTKAYLRGDYDSSAYAHFVRLLHDRLGEDYAPDVVIVLGHAPFMREAYPQAKLFHHEYSFFSRRPYPTTFAFDPFGLAYGFTISRAAEAIGRVPATEDELRAIDGFRENVLRALRGSQVVTDYFAGLRAKYKKILLLPLGCDDSTDTLVRQPCHGHFEMVEHVLDSVDADTCVCLTQHPTFPAIPPQRIRELIKIHPNLKYEDWYQAVPFFSQVALAYVDACAFDYTSVAYQAVFLGVRSVSLGGFCDGVADAAGYDQLRDVFSRVPVRRDAFVAWVLKHYAIEEGDMARQLARYIDSDFAVGGYQGDVIQDWPQVLSGEELVARLQHWAETCVKDFAAELATFSIEASRSVAEQLRESQRIRSEIWRRLQGSQKSETDLRTRLTNTEKMRGEMWSRLQESQAVRSKMWAQLQETRSQLQESQAVRHKIWGRVQKAEAGLQVSEKELTEFRGMLTKATDALTKATADLDVETKQRQAADQTVSRLERDLAALDRELAKSREKCQALERSWSYRLGRLLTMPFRLVKSSCRTKRNKAK